MKIQERYSVARHTSNLKVETSTTFAPADVLAAAGMAGQASPEALMLWEVTFKGKTSSKLALVAILEKKLAWTMLHNRWKGDPRRIAQEVVAWSLHGSCQPCGGRGFELVMGTPSLSDRLCKHCNGTKKVALPRTDPHDWLHDYMDRLISQAAGQVMRRLATDMDLR